MKNKIKRGSERVKLANTHQLTTQSITYSIQKNYLKQKEFDPF